MCVCEHTCVRVAATLQLQGSQAGRGHRKQGVDRAGLSRGPQWGHSAELGGGEGRQRWSRAPSPYLVPDASGERWVTGAMVLGPLVGPRADWGRGPGLQHGWGWAGRRAQPLGQWGLRPHTHGHSITRPQPPSARRSPGPMENPTKPPCGGRAGGCSTHQGPLPPPCHARENPGHPGKLTPEKRVRRNLRIRRAPTGRTARRPPGPALSQQRPRWAASVRGLLGLRPSPSQSRRAAA